MAGPVARSTFISTAYTVSASVFTSTSPKLPWNARAAGPRKVLTSLVEAGAVTGGNSIVLSSTPETRFVAQTSPAGAGGAETYRATGASLRLRGGSAPGAR
jgi:hypothetical protein